MNVAILYQEDDIRQIQVYLRCKSAFAKRGVNLEFLSNTDQPSKTYPDVVVCQKQSINAWAMQFPIIIEESTDSSMLMSRDELGMSNVIKLYKNCVALPEWTNIPTERSHCWIMEKVEDRKSQRLISPEDRRKVSAGINIGMFTRMERWADRASRNRSQMKWENRPIDVLFMGKCTYKRPSITAHRKRAFDKLRSINGFNIVVASERSCSCGEYFALSNYAKVIVSPWGYGELCYRDYEAYFDECTLVKPDTSHVETLGNIFEKGRYLPCSYMFDDLEETIVLAMQDKFVNEESRLSNRELALYWWKPENIVNWWIDQYSLVRT